MRKENIFLFLFEKMIHHDRYMGKFIIIIIMNVYPRHLFVVKQTLANIYYHDVLILEPACRFS